MPSSQDNPVRFLEVAAEGGAPLRIAYEDHTVAASSEPGLVWFPGFNSTMSSTKISALKSWAAERGRSLVCFDYSGHGSSDGDAKDGTISQWLAESLAILRKVPSGPQILVGSSMGAWLVLLILRAISRDDPLAAGIPAIAGAMLIAPAHDMTEELMWKEFSDEARKALEAHGYYERPSRYGDGPYIISRKLIEDGRNHLIGHETFEPPCPVRIMHGMEDPDVPWSHGNELTHILTGDDVSISFIQDGDHRLSRDKDIETMQFILDDLYESISEAIPSR